MSAISDATGTMEQQQQQQQQQQRHEREQPPYGRVRGWSDDGMSGSEQGEGVVKWNKAARIVCAVLLPPLGVFLQVGCSKDLAINALLTILGCVPTRACRWLCRPCTGTHWLDDS
jgi:uncharacterized membrane protein YqaE (UPF0057 family)